MAEDVAIEPYQTLASGRRRTAYLHVVTTALSVRRARHLSELQRKGKSMICSKKKGV